MGSSLKSGAHAVSSAQCEFLEYGGHSSHVMNVRWSVGDETGLKIDKYICHEIN